jgi:hypothetical protein
MQAGTFSSSSSSSGSSSEDDDGMDSHSRDASSDDDGDADVNNVPGAADDSSGRKLQQLGQVVDRPTQRQQQQQQQQWRLSSAWSVLELLVTALTAQQQVLLLATSNIPVEQLPHDMQQFFNWPSRTARSYTCQQQQQQQQQVVCADHAVVQTCCLLGNSDGCRSSIEHSQLQSSPAALPAHQQAADSAIDRALLAAGLLYQQANSLTTTGPPGAAACEHDAALPAPAAAGAAAVHPEHHAAQAVMTAGVNKQQGRPDVAGANPLQQQPLPVTQQQQLQHREEVQQPCEQQQLALMPLNEADKERATQLYQQVSQCTELLAAAASGHSSCKLCVHVTRYDWRLNIAGTHLLPECDRSSSSVALQA